MHRSLLFSKFDNEAACAFGVKTGAVQPILSILLMFIHHRAHEVVGVIMIAATLIASAMTARKMADSFRRMLIYSALIGSVAGVIGMYLSYILNIASGAATVLFSALLFCLSLLLKPIRKKRMLRERFQRHGSLETLNK